MTKGDFITSIQHRLSSGDTPNDIMGRYSYVAIETAVETALIGVARNVKGVFQNMGMLFEGIELNNSGGIYYLSLPARPISGGLSVKWVTDDCGVQYFGHSSIDEGFLLNAIKPQAKPEWTWGRGVPGTANEDGVINGNVLTFSYKPGNGPYSAFYIPSIMEMDDTYGFILTDEFQDVLFRSVIDLFKGTDNRPQEVISDTSQDNAAKPPKFNVNTPG